MLNVSCPDTSSADVVNVSCEPAVPPADWASSMERQEISRILSGLVLSVVIVAFSAPPAAVIWRTPSLHRVSYLYVMVLSLLDCLLGAFSLSMACAALLLGLLVGGIPCWLCVVLEAATNGCMNAVNVVMLALGRDRYLSLAHALSYPLLATSADVRRHVKMAAAYGALHAAIFIGARVYYGCVNAVQKSCLPLNWLLMPEYRFVAAFTVSFNIFLDVGTITYNGFVMYCAWKLRRKQVHPQCLDQEQGQPNQRSTTNAVRHHMRIFVFTFKLACLFLVCSLPYKLAIVLFCLGAHSSVNLIRVLALIRMMYFILDGWTFCSNRELLDAVKAMFKIKNSGECLSDRSIVLTTNSGPG
ncbi:uncharacterized protein LOC122372035 [Amphibalanus amphitrite]|uniref:uncharacterized protein LOC122372035 n=1 Tax=Amphibalanus amphitrite TaxID=1232801 RepID=UPI001C8FD543|nr:uncharacterized protein LOC122372035 [Amphibalanus amphitrite]